MIRTDKKRCCTANYAEKKGKRYSALKMYSKMCFAFFKTYILKLGVLDGKEGFLLSKVSALSVYENFKALKREEEKNGK